MKRFYVTKKQVENYIVKKLDSFESIEDFKQEVAETVESFSDGTDKAQLKFFTRVQESLEHFVQ